MKQASPVLVPPYSTAQPNAPVTLYEGPIVVEQDNQQVNCDAQVIFEWVPSPRITFYSTESSDDAIPALAAISLSEKDKPDFIQIPGATAPVEVYVTNNSRSAGPEGTSVRISGRCADPIVFHRGVDLKYVLFHLVNFDETSEGVIEDDSCSWMGRATAEFDGWKLILDTVRDFGELEKANKSLRGYAITHAARLERVDGSLFTVAQVKEVLSGLFWFLSLARGLWSPPVLPVGFDTNGNQVWQEWQALRSTAWRSASGWLSDRQYVSASLQESLRGFWTKWNTLTWNDPVNNNTPLILAIHWFVSSNNDAGGVEGSIILAQTGLELVAWVRLVEDEKVYTKNQFDGLNAAQKFEALLQHSGVNDAVPTGLSNLTALSTAKGWANGPAAIAGYRNTIVHPKRRAQNKDVVFQESYEMLELALWYLELSLLHLFGYQGFYVNRLQASPRIAGVTERVPWAPP